MPPEVAPVVARSARIRPNVGVNVLDESPSYFVNDIPVPTWIYADLADMLER
jgi:hypothetical protein